MYDQFYKITLGLMENWSEFACDCRCGLGNFQNYQRLCRTGNLARSEGDVKFLPDNFMLACQPPNSVCQTTYFQQSQQPQRHALYTRWQSHFLGHLIIIILIS